LASFRSAQSAIGKEAVLLSPRELRRIAVAAVLLLMSNTRIPRA